MKEPTLETNEPEEEELTGRNAPRVYTSLRKQINGLMGFVKRVARLTRDMSDEKRQETEVEFRTLCNEIWAVLRNLHRDDCKCDDCLLERVFEDR